MSTTLYRRAQLPELPDDPADAPRRWSVLVSDGIVSRVAPDGGSDAPADETIDLDGALLLPGFVDAHAHVTDTGLLLAGVDCSPARSVTDILDRVAALARRIPGRQILGHGWDELNLAEGRAPTAAELDRAGGGAVVYLSRIDVHSAVVSGALADRAGLRGLEGWDADGRVERDAHHAARHATRFDIPAADRRELQLLALRQARAAGITRIHEMSAPHIAPDVDLLALLELTDPTELIDLTDGDLAGADRTGLPVVVPYRGELAVDEAGARLVLDRFGGRLAGLAGDLMMDGSFGSRTAGLHADYQDAHGHRGHLYATAEQVRDHVLACTGAGVQGGFHVIGDGAVHELVEGLRLAAKVVGQEAIRTAAHRLEHVEGADADDIATLARLGVIASVQPAFDAFWGGRHQMYAIRLGADRALAMNPFAAMARAGVTLAFGSDSPVTPFSPWEGVRAALTHHNEEQRIGIGPALAAHTLGGLRAARQPAPASIRIREGDRVDLAAWISAGIASAASVGRPAPLAALAGELAGGDPVPARVLPPAF